MEEQVTRQNNEPGIESSEEEEEDGNKVVLKTVQY
jgi:hypothetical protein